MPRVPEIDVITPGNVAIGGVSSDNPRISDQSASAKATRYERLSNIMEREGREYQVRWERQQRAQKQLTASTEGISALRYGADLLEKSKSKPDDDIPDYIFGEFEKYHQQAYEKYGADPELWADVSYNIQRAALDSQDKGFNFAQKRKKDAALAAIIQGENDLANTAVVDDNEASVQLRFDQFDDMLGSTVQAGWMDKADAAKASIGFKSRVYSARVANMISNDKFQAAENYLAANRQYIDLERQVTLETSIINGKERVAAKAERLALKRISDQLAFDNTMASDPAYAVIRYKGVPADNWKLVADATGGRAAVPNGVINQIKDSLVSAKSADDFASIISGWRGKAEQQGVLEIFDRQMDQANFPSSVRLASDLARNGSRPQLDALFEMYGQEKNVKELTKDTKDEDLTTELVSTADPYLAWKTRQGNPQNVAEYIDNVNTLARWYKWKNKGATDYDAIAFATGGTADGYKAIYVDGRAIPVPISPDLSTGDVENGLSMQKQTLLSPVEREAATWDLSADGKTFELVAQDGSPLLVNGKVPTISVDQAQILGAANRHKDIIEMKNPTTIFSPEFE